MERKKDDGEEKKVNRNKFTSGVIEDHECEEGKSQSFLWDTEVTYLALRTTKTGKKSYVFEGSLKNKSIRVTIGSPNDWTITNARKEARRLRSEVDSGIDPRQAKKALIAKQEAKRQAEKDQKLKDSLLVSDAWSAYLNHHQKRWGERHYKDHLNLSQKGGEPMKRGKRLTVQGVVYPLLQMRMVDITADSLKAWQSKEAETRANNARQGYELFRALWRWCADHPDYKNIVDVSAVDNKDLRAEVPTRKSKKFDVFEKSQIKAWFEGVTGLDNPVISAYLQALLLTGARRNEMADLKWRDVDFKWSALWLKDKVHDEGRKVPLTPYLASLIDGLPRRNEWVFSSPQAENGKMSEPTRAHKRALSAVGLEVVTLHGLRRTFASLAEWVEIPTGVVAQIMGHAPNATAERHYINRPLDLLAVWHNKYEAWILEQAGVEFSGSGQQPDRLRVIS